MEKIKEVFTDTEFVQELFQLETLQEVQQALSEKGVDLTNEEISTIRECLIKIESGEISPELVEKLVNRSSEEELSEEELELISGGFLGFGTAFVLTVGEILKEVFLAVGLGAAAATAGGGVTFGVLDAVKRRW